MTIIYNIRHTTDYQYSEPVSVCHNLLCLTPRNRPGQRVTARTLTIEPLPTIAAERTDAFGNTLRHFSIEHAHDHLSIDAQSTIELDEPPPPPADDPAWETVAQAIASQTDPNWLETVPFLADSAFAKRSEEATAFARTAFAPGRPVFEAALAFTTQIYTDFAYKPGSTQVHTNSDEALTLRSGVCQDFAHVGIAAMRGLGIPVRYVSGYLRTLPPPGKPRLVGADQSHAWFTVYCGPNTGWVDLDPTNNTRCGTDHITLALGRDYDDVAPVRGVFTGGGASTLAISVDVAPAG